MKMELMVLFTFSKTVVVSEFRLVKANIIL